MRKFELVESEDLIRPGTYLIWSQDGTWIRVDGTLADGNELSDVAYAAYYFPTKEAAELALIAAKIRGDAL